MLKTEQLNEIKEIIYQQGEFKDTQIVFKIEEFKITLHESENSQAIEINDKQYGKRYIAWRGDKIIRSTERSINIKTGEIKKIIDPFEQFMSKYLIENKLYQLKATQETKRMKI